MLREFDERDPPGGRSSAVARYFLAAVSALTMMALLISAARAILG